MIAFSQKKASILSMVFDFFALLDHFKELGMTEEEIAHWKNNFASEQGRVVCVRPKKK